MNYNFTRVIEDEMVDFLERMSYELEGSKRIIKELILENPDNPAMLDSETFKHYKAKYDEHNAQYEIAKKELQNKYIPKKIQDSGTLLKWNLDYDTAVLTVTVVGDMYKDMTMEEFFND